MEPVILHEQPNQGHTILEKFIKSSDVQFAVVILTGDDRGGIGDGDPEDFSPRPRQNVVLELGYFLAHLGRSKVCPLYEHGVEIPSDYDGIGFVELDAAGGWKFQLARELRTAGLSIDLNKAL